MGVAVGMTAGGGVAVRRGCGGTTSTMGGGRAVGRVGGGGAVGEEDSVRKKPSGREVGGPEPSREESRGGRPVALGGGGSNLNV
jgi:hypothetical protein